MESLEFPSAKGKSVDSFVLSSAEGKSLGLATAEVDSVESADGVSSSSSGVGDSEFAVRHGVSQSV